MATQIEVIERFKKMIIAKNLVSINLVATHFLLTVEELEKKMKDNVEFKRLETIMLQKNTALIDQQIFDKRPDQFVSRNSNYAPKISFTINETSVKNSKQVLDEALELAKQQGYLEEYDA